MARPSLPDDLIRDKSEVVRVSKQEQAELTAAAVVLGSNKSSLLHVHILDLIDKAKARDREKFDRVLASLLARPAQKKPAAKRKPK